MDLTELVSFRPEYVTDNKWDQETVRVVLVHPPIVREFREHGGVDENESGNDGEGSPEILNGNDTHTKFLEAFRQEKGNFLAKNERVTRLSPKTETRCRAYIKPASCDKHKSRMEQ